MRKFFASLIALAYLFAATPAPAGFLLNSYSVVPAEATVTFVGCTVSGTAGTSATFTDHATGVAGNRWTIVGVGLMDNATNFSTTSLTVGGNSATEITDTADTGSTSQNSIYIISNPTGTTATIVLTASESVFGFGVCVWAGYNLTSATADDTAIGFQTSSAAITLDLNVPSDGFAIGVSTTSAVTATTTWTGMTERSDQTMGPNANFSSADTDTAGTPLTVSSDWTGTADATGATASFN